MNQNDVILDSLGEGVFTVDKNFKITFFNKAAEKISGYKRDEVIGKFCKHIFKSDLCFHNCPIAIVLQSQKNLYDFESKLHTSSGKIKTIKLNAAILKDENDSSEAVGGVLSFREISDFETIKAGVVDDTHFFGIVGRSKQMKKIFNLIEEISNSNAPVFISGESGTGKELVANAIQKTSKRSEFPYIKVNCSVFPDNLLASELFGHVKGAFTDAHCDRPGRFEIANNGTLFLDEIAETSLQTQIQLLRVIQQGTFERIGESVTRTVDVRIIGATNININSALSSGKFREDLYYRLNVIPIEIPPLRERKEDIIPLVYNFLKRFSVQYKKEIIDVEERVLDCFNEYEWPGNVRELENVIEYAFVRTNKHNFIEVEQLPENVKCRNKRLLFGTLNLSDNPKLSEKTQLIELLSKHKWNKSKVSEELGIGRTTLWRRLKKYGLVD